MNDRAKMRVLLSRLTWFQDKLESGELSKKELKKAIESIHKLYEKWLIVKLKMQTDDEGFDFLKDSFVEGFEAPKNSFKQSELKVGTVAEDPVSNMQLIDKQEELFENQTSLIEIIEEIQEDQSINERLSKGQISETRAQKHAKSPIENLEKSIGLNQKFSFIKHLFDNDKKAYDEAINTLNSCTGFIEADDFIENQLKKQFLWEEETVYVVKFIDLVERRYLSTGK